MNNNIKMIALIVFGIIVLSIFRIKYSDYNLNRTISACVLAQKRSSDSFDIEKAKSFCEKKIKEQLNFSK